MARRQHLSLMLMVGVVMFFSLTWFMSSKGSPDAESLAASGLQYQTSSKQGSTPMGAVDFGGLDNILAGGSIAPKLGNETLKYVNHTPGLHILTSSHH